MQGYLSRANLVDARNPDVIRPGIRFKIHNSAFSPYQLTIGKVFKIEARQEICR